MDQESKNLVDTADSLRNRVKVLEESIEGDRARTVRVNKVAEVIRKTLPKNTDCTRMPTPAEVNQIAQSIIEYGDRYSVSPSLILGMIRRESAFCIDIVSHAGAQGLMQLMPETAESQAIEIAAEVKYMPKPSKVRDNIWIGTYYISKRLVDFRGNEDLALKAYNAGITHVKKVLSGERADYYEEPKIYSVKVLKYKEEYRRLGIE
jgi:soluble lytic murein transglycosylase-like protein